MTSTNKVWTLTFTILLLTSLLILATTPTKIQATAKPSIPQFSVKLISVDHESWRGEKTIEKRVEVTIKNQPFTSDTNTDTYGTGGGGFDYVAPDKTSLYYQVQAKGHLDEEWTYFTYDTIQSDSSYTVASNGIAYTGGSQIDFRVQAVAGYTRQYASSYGMPLGQELVAKAESDWSRPQTININNGYSTAAPSQTTTSQTNSPMISDNNQTYLPNQTQPSFVFHQSFLLWIGALLFVGVVIAVVIVFTKRQLRTSTYNKDFTN